MIKNGIVSYTAGAIHESPAKNITINKKLISPQISEIKTAPKSAVFCIYEVKINAAIYYASETVTAIEMLG